MGARLERFKSTVRAHKVLSAVLGAYLALSAVELVRILLYDRPRDYDAGFYQWETTQGPAGGAREFHWTRGGEAYVLRPLWGPVVRFPLYLAHPSLPPEGVRVSLAIDGRVFHEQVLEVNGWHLLDLYLPAAMGTNPWSETPVEMALQGAGELRPVEGEEPFGQVAWTLAPVPDYIRVFTEWRRPPGPPSLWFELRVQPTFRPDDYAETDDDRELGVGLAELLWMRKLPDEGIGFHSWEQEGDRAFRWSRGWATAPVAIDVPAALAGSAEGTFWVRAADPGAAERPVTMRAWWGTRPLPEITLADTAWHPVRLRTEPRQRLGALSVSVDRTWSPARAGVSGDARELGVAVSRIEWER